MLVIDPGTCADCAACVPECPVYAIYPEDEVPEPYREWIAKNEELYASGVVVTSKVDPLPGALSLDEIRKKEKEKGWTVPAPSEVSDDSPSGGEEKPAEAEAPPAEQAEVKAGRAPEPEAPAPAGDPAPERKEEKEESAPPARPESPPAAEKAGTPPGKETAASPGEPKPEEQPSPAAGEPAPAQSPPAEKPAPKAPAPEPAAPREASSKEGPPGYQAKSTHPLLEQPQPPLDVNPRGRIRLGHRTGTVQIIRKGPRKFFTDMRIQFDGEEKPVWYVYSALQTFKERGDLEILDRGPEPGLLQKIFG